MIDDEAYDAAEAQRHEQEKAERLRAHHDYRFEPVLERPADAILTETEIVS